jgi:fatty acid desaturase
MLSAAIALTFTMLLHAAHDRVHRPGWFVPMLMSLPLLINYTVYRRTHLQHHRYLGTAADPEGGHELLSLGAYLRYLLLTPLTALVDGLGQAARGNYPSFLSARELQQARWSHWVLSVWIVATLIVTAFFPLEMFTYYWAPLYVGGFLVDAFVALPEHVNLRNPESGKVGCRVVLTNKVFAFITMNVGLHALHHARPSLRWHELPGALRDWKPGPDIVVIKGYLRFHGQLIHNLIVGQGTRGANEPGRNHQAVDAVPGCQSQGSRCKS